jgi:glycine cleavage system pyridoxal-binding protein P
METLTIEVGPSGLTEIARRGHRSTMVRAKSLRNLAG